MYLHSSIAGFFFIMCPIIDTFIPVMWNCRFLPVNGILWIIDYNKCCCRLFVLLHLPSQLCVLQKWHMCPIEKEPLNNLVVLCYLHESGHLSMWISSFIWLSHICISSLPRIIKSLFYHNMECWVLLDISL